MDEPIALEERGWQALSSSGEKARRFYDEVLAEDVLMLLPGGLRLDDRAVALDSMGGAPWQAFELADVAQLEVTPDVAVVAYRAVARREGATYTALCASTYVRDGDGWKLCLHQQTPV